MHILLYKKFDVTNCPAKLLWNVPHFSVEMWSLFSWCKLMENNNEVVVQVRFVLSFGNEVLYSRYCKPPFTARVKSVMPAKSPAILPRWKWYWLGCECVWCPCTTLTTSSRDSVEARDIIAKTMYQQEDGLEKNAEPELQFDDGETSVNTKTL